jgi:hypothetical protein
VLSDDETLDVLGVGHHATEGEAVVGDAGVDAVAARRGVPPLDGSERDAVDAGRQLGAPRVLGALKEKSWIADNFDAPLDEDFLFTPGGDGRRER